MDENLTDDAKLVKTMAAFGATDLGVALETLRTAIICVDRELRKQPKSCGTDGARHALALNGIVTDVLRDRPLEALSVRELELLRVLFEYWRTTTEDGPGATVSDAIFEMQLAGILVPTGERVPTGRGSMADLWMFASDRLVS